MKKTKLHRILSVAPMTGLKIAVEFDDGRIVVGDLTKVADRGGIFERLRDEKYFRRARVANGGRSLAWPDRLDFCADALYIEQARTRRSKGTANAFDAQIFAPATEVVAA